MFIADGHTHSKYSFDGPDDISGEIDSICSAAIVAGLSEVAITDHLEINGEVEGIYPPCNCENIRRDVFAAKEKFSGKLYVCYGIELGQAAEYPEQAREYLKKFGYEYVAGSLHSLPGVPDFSFFNYKWFTDKHIEKLFSDNIKALCDLCDFEGINTIAHFTYLHRYTSRANRKLNFENFIPQIKDFFAKVIYSGKALEVNTSTLRSDKPMTMPTHDLLRLYRECGGELITCGSDSHGSEFIGAGIKETYEFLASAGFKYVTVFHDGKPQMNKIV